MKKTIFALVVLVGGYFFVSSFKKKANLTEKDNGFNILFNLHVPPDWEGATTAQSLCSFAWSEFFSLNWKSSYGQGFGSRGNPDANWRWDFDEAPFPNGPLVWETYTHRTELRPAKYPMRPWNSKPYYDFLYQPTPLPGTDTTVFHCLDENNEIGSCNLYAFASSYQKQYQVLYQAKCNRDEYDYVYNNYNTADSLQAAARRTRININLYNAYYYKAPLLNCDLDPKQRVIALPCGTIPKKRGSQLQEGAIEVKSAWRPATPKDTVEKFFRRNVLVFEQRINGKDTQTVSLNKTYLLIGLHIIHKTATYPNFVFATWEHKDVDNHDMAFQLLDRNNNDSLGLMTGYHRYHDIDPVADASTKEAHRLLAQKNPNSIWLNYRLVGVQGNPTNNTKSFSFFLANYVVESDSTLGDFHGSGIHSPHNKGNNILYMGNRYSMGGCQGCHGVAQLTLGTDMSFLLDSIGKPVDGPDISIAGNKLQRYINAIRKIQAELRQNSKR